MVLYLLNIPKGDKSVVHAVCLSSLEITSLIPVIE